MSGFVPDDFVVPGSLAADGFRLEPLGPQHNEDDYRAWTSSVEHIRSTPGYPDGRWPREMTLAENLGDLGRHAADYAARRGFTYTVLADDGGEVLGCVYVYPLADGRDGADVRSWVRADRADLDVPLHDAVSAWLREAWPFATIAYAPR